MKLNMFYQVFAPLVLFIVLLGTIMVNLWAALGIILFVVFINITLDCFYEQYNRFILEIFRFGGYLTIVLFSVISLMIIVDSSSVMAKTILLAILLVGSLHIRLFKYDNLTKKITYNDKIYRTKAYNKSNTFVYPEITNFVLFRVEFYIVLLLMIQLIAGLRSIFLSNNPAVTSVDVVMVLGLAVIIDVFIYLGLSKFTTLLNPKIKEDNRRLQS